MKNSKLQIGAALLVLHFAFCILHCSAQPSPVEPGTGTGGGGGGVVSNYVGSYSFQTKTTNGTPYWLYLNTPFSMAATTGGAILWVAPTGNSYVYSNLCRNFSGSTSYDSIGVWVAPGGAWYFDSLGAGGALYGPQTFTYVTTNGATGGSGGSLDANTTNWIKLTATNAAQTVVTDATNTLRELIISTNNLQAFNVWKYGAYPDDGTDDTAAIKAAGKAAEVAGGLVVFEAGRYNISTNYFDTSRKTEGHDSVLTLWSNNVFFVGKGSRATELFLTYTPATLVNLIGAGSAAGDSYANRWGVTNVGIIGLSLNANGGSLDMTQFYYADRCYFLDVGMQNISGNDAWDTQYGDRIYINNCWARSIAGNCISSQDEHLFVDGFTATDCSWEQEARVLDGRSTTSPAFQILGGAAVIRNVTMSGCGGIFEGGATFEDCRLGSTNTTYTNIVVNYTSTFRNCNFEDITFGSTGWQIYLPTNSTLYLNDCTAGNRRPFCENDLGRLYVTGCNIGGGGDEMVFKIRGGTNEFIGNSVSSGNGACIRNEDATKPAHNVVICNNKFGNLRGGHTGNWIYSDSTGGTNWLVAGNQFLEGTVRLYENVAGNKFLRNYVAGTLVTYGAVLIQGNTIDTFSNGGGTPVVTADNYIRTGYSTGLAAPPGVPSGIGGGLYFTNAAGSKFLLIVNSTTNGLTFTPTP